MSGGAVGEVVASRVADLAAGDVVVHDLGWREYALVDAGGGVSPRARRRRAGQRLARRPRHGRPDRLRRLLEIAALKAGDAVFVSGAAGRRGQPGRPDRQAARRARVIGSAGSAEKVAASATSSASTRRSTTTTARSREQLAAAAPDGIDVYFDNVGGEHLEAAVGGAAPARPRGAVRRHLAVQPPVAGAGPRNLGLADRQATHAARLPRRRPRRGLPAFAR